LFGFEADRVIYGIPESLLAADVALRRLDADMSEQKLNLIQFSSGFMTQTASPTKAIWSSPLTALSGDGSTLWHPQDSSWNSPRHQS
jgi:hypothetical protein